MKKVVVMMIVALFAFTGVAAARGPGGGGAGMGPGGIGPARGMSGGPLWERPRVVKALSLTEEEQAALTGLHREHQADTRDLRDEIREARGSLKGVMGGEDFSPTKARKLFKMTEKIEAKLNNKRFEMNLEQRSILGRERFAKLQKMKRRFRAQRR